jgi:hypothetical protein
MCPQQESDGALLSASPIILTARDAGGAQSADEAVGKLLTVAEEQLVSRGARRVVRLALATSYGRKSRNG